MPDELDQQKIEGKIRTVENGGPSGESVIEFADPHATTGKIEIDLEGVDLSSFDELHFDLWMKNDVTDITVTLWGYPDDHSGRRWYAFKRFQPLEQWTDIRLDLRQDDDLSGEHFENSPQKLVIEFRRPDTTSDSFARARIHDLRWVRNPLKIEVDYRQATHRTSLKGLTFTYPVHLENMTEHPMIARLEVLSETLEHFIASHTENSISIPPGDSITTYIELVVNGAELNALPSGHVERAKIQAVVPDIQGFEAVPIRGFRPIYLFGFVPPPEDSRDAIFKQLQSRASRMSADSTSYESDLRWEVEKPPLGVTPSHPASFRCPECRSLLDMDNLYTYFCYSRDISGQCPLHLQRVTIDKHHRLFPPMLDNYHSKTLRIARNLALGWLRTGDKRLAKRAFEILKTYELFYREIPQVAPGSVAFQSRFRSASLFERHLLEYMTDTWFILSETEAVDPEELRRIAEGLILDSLQVVNQFYYGFSASQIDMVTQVLKASIILERWPFAADAIGGDSGILRILERNFNADGVPIDGGDYARQAARQIMILSDSLTNLNIDIEKDRLRQIEENSKLLGYLPRPDDYAMRTTVLEKTGFTILVNGNGATRRRATINWGSTRERSGHDHLTTVLYDAQDDELLLRTRRVMWGHPHANLAFQSFAQNIPVIDRGNISSARLRQEYLRDDATAAGILISDYPERPAYPDSRLMRALVLFEGCLLVLDRFVSSTGERLVDFPLNGLSTLSGFPGGMSAYDLPLGDSLAYRLPHDLQTKMIETLPFTAQWSDGNRGVNVHALGNDFQAFVGKTYMGRNARSVPRDFLMLRTRAESVTAAFLYEATHGGHPMVTHFSQAVVQSADGASVSEDQAVAFDVRFDNGRHVRVLISLDGGTYHSGDAATDYEKRISLRSTD